MAKWRGQYIRSSIDVRLLKLSITVAYYNNKTYALKTHHHSLCSPDGMQWNPGFFLSTAAEALPDYAEPVLSFVEGLYPGYMRSWFESQVGAAQSAQYRTFQRGGIVARSVVTCQ